MLMSHALQVCGDVGRGGGGGEGEGIDADDHLHLSCWGGLGGVGGVGGCGRVLLVPRPWIG